MTKKRLSYECKFTNILFHVVDGATCFFLFLFIPKQILIKRVTRELFKKRLLPNNKDVVYFKSGRAALHGFLVSLEKINKKYNIIFLPDYICNVVYQAAEKAGFSIYSYKTDDSFSPIWNDLIRSIRDKSYPVVLLASMFGRVNSCQTQIEKIFDSNPEAFVIADECQHLVTNSSVGYGNNMAVLFSFNGKTIPGLMGGGICVDRSIRKFIEPVKLKMLKCAEINARLFFHLAKEIILYIVLFLEKSLPFHVNTPMYDYSVGRNILYDTSPHGIAKLSVIRAWVCLKKIECIESLRVKNFMVIFNILQDKLLCPYLPEQRRAAYIPITKESLQNNLLQFVLIKRPYAIHKKPKSAIKEIYCLMNSIPLRLVGG